MCHDDNVNEKRDKAYHIHGQAGPYGPENVSTPFRKKTLQLFIKINSFKGLN